MRLESPLHRRQIMPEGRDVAGSGRWGSKGSLDQGLAWDRMAYFDSPLLLGFEHTRALLERASRGAPEGYPPYNIEDCGKGRIRITLAVAGFTRDQLQVEVGDNQLTIAGRREPEEGAAERDFVHRGIAARGFTRVFVLADGMEVTAARLGHGLLHIEAERPPPRRPARQVPIERAG